MLRTLQRLLLAAIAFAPMAAKAGEPRWFLINNFSGAVFPSFEIATAAIPSQTRLKDHLDSFLLRVTTDAPTQVDITFSSTHLLKNSRTTRKIGAGNHFLPLVEEWDFTALYAVIEPVPESFTISVAIGGRPAESRTFTYQVRSINDCVTGFKEPFGKHSHDLRELFAAYVDENDPVTDEILHEAIKRGLIRNFEGYHQGPAGAERQLAAIWQVLQSLKVTYSSILTPSGYTSNVTSQHVRFAHDSLRNAEANCVDGSVLMAGIFRKVGLKTYLVVIPGHCYLAVERNQNGSDRIGIETTMIGTGATFAAAETKGTNQLIEAEQKIQMKQPGYEIVDIDQARKQGIQPLHQLVTLDLTDLIKGRGPETQPAEE